MLLLRFSNLLLCNTELELKCKNGKAGEHPRRRLCHWMKKKAVSARAAGIGWVGWDGMGWDGGAEVSSVNSTL